MFFSQSDITLELLGVFKLTRNDFTLRSAAKRNYDSLSIRVNGKGHFKTGNNRFTVKRGDLLYIPKTASYTHQTAGETLIAIHFINYTFDRGNVIEKITLNDGNRFEEHVQKMYNVWKEKKPGYRYECSAMLYELLGMCYRQEHEKQTVNDSLGSGITKVADYIHSHFRNEQIEISKLAQMCSLSEPYFRKLFKRHYGVSPKQYVINLQLETAAQLLQSQLYSVSEACERSGFADSKYFAKLFKSRYGFSPKQYQSQPPEKNFR